MTTTANDRIAPTALFTRSTLAQRRLHELVPDGTHTYARASDQYPEDMAPVLVRGHGARVWDLDGHEYVEYGMGLRAVTLAHGYEPMLEAVERRIWDGVCFTRHRDQGPVHATGPPPRDPLDRSPSR